MSGDTALPTSKPTKSYTFPGRPCPASVLDDDELKGARLFFREQSTNANQEAFSEANTNKQMVRWTRAVARYTEGLVLVAVVTALVSALQWYEIHRGSADTKELATSAKLSAEIAREALDADARAWIATFDASLKEKPQIGKELNVSIKYKNFGKEPVSLFYTVSEFNSADMQGANLIAKVSSSSCVQLRHFEANAFAVPGGSNSSEYQLHLDSKLPLADNEIINGSKSLVFLGCFVYISQSKIRHTAFCYYYNNLTI